MTAPTLSISIPQTQVQTQFSPDGPTPKYIVKNGSVVPRDDVESEAESERSSICHSPGWDSDTTRRKRKAKHEAAKKRKMEKKRLETEAKHALKMKNRLTKPPPTNKRLSKMVFAPDRSTSAPTIPTLAETRQEGQKTSTDRSRRGSMNLEFKSLFGWKSGNASPTETTPSNESPPSRDGGRFIGGLKLRLSEEATTQGRTRTNSSVDEDKRLALLMKRDAAASPSSASRTKKFSADEDPRRSSVQTSATPTSQHLARTQRDATNTKAGKMTNGFDNSESTSEDIPIMGRNVKKSRKSRVSVNGSFDPWASYNEDSSSSSNGRLQEFSKLKPSQNRNNHDKRPSLEPSKSPDKESSFSFKKPRNRPETMAFGPSGSYVEHHRRQSQDEAVANFEYESRVSAANAPERSPRRTPESFHSVKSHASLEELDSSRQNDTIDDAHPFFTENYVPPQLILEDRSPTTPSSPEFQELKSPRGLKGLEDVAKAAFSRYSISPTDHDPVSPDAIKAMIASGRPSINTSENITERSSSRTHGSDSTLTEPLENSPQATQPPNFSVHPSHHPPIPGRNSSSAAVQKSHNTRGSRWPSTDSSEEYSTFDESSNVTTPMPSRPTSKRDQVPGLQVERNGYISGNDSSSTLPRNGKNVATMSGAIPYDTAINGSRDSWSGTAVPISLTDDEDRAKTPKTIPGPSVLSETDEISTAESDAGLNRQPSLSRSFSTPGLQDLSFLPALKHQSLARPPNPKGKDPASKPKNHLPPTTIIKPLTTKSEGSSPTSPQLPSSPAIKPIAKMFVECCFCHFFHDMPSKIYECMANAPSVVQDKERGVHGVVSTNVKCPWCGHGMSTSCCGGWAAVVWLKERLH